MLTQLFKKEITMDIELPRQAERMMKSTRARKKRRFIKDIRELRQHNFYAKLHKQKKKKAKE